MAFQLNQFKLTNQIGEVMNPAANVIAVRLSSTYTPAAQAGDVVKFNATEDGDTPVVNPAISGDAGQAVILFNAKKATYAALDVTEAALTGTIVTMAAAAALNRRQLVSWDSVRRAVQATATNQNYIGYTLDEAAVTGDLVRVFIQPTPNALA